MATIGSCSDLLKIVVWFIKFQALWHGLGRDDEEEEEKENFGKNCLLLDIDLKMRTIQRSNKKEDLSGTRNRKKRMGKPKLMFENLYVS